MLLQAANKLYFSPSALRGSTDNWRAEWSKGWDSKSKKVEFITPHRRNSKITFLFTNTGFNLCSWSWIVSSHLQTLTSSLFSRFRDIRVSSPYCLIFFYFCTDILRFTGMLRNIFFVSGDCTWISEIDHVT